MQFIFFSKMVKEQSIPRLIETLRYVGADGVDLAVRDGYPVSPANVRRALPEAAKQIRDAGLSIPMVTAPTSLADASAPLVEDLWAACHDAQVPHVKIGYWAFAGSDYWKQVDSARRQIEGFEKVATRYGVKACLHTHSGGNLGVNAAAMMHLAKGFNPSAVGVYLDPGHLALNGEPLEMAFAMASEYLSLVAIKDSLWVKGEGGKPRTARFLPLGDGFVDWAGLMRILRARSYAGPLSFHSEYEGWSMEKIIEQTKKDVAYLRDLNH